MNPNPIITVKDFSKSFGNKKIIKDLDFEVFEGDIFAFLGPNGSGKTTTLRCLLGIYKTDKGELLINGKSYVPSDSSILGYLPEERGLYLTSRVLETLIYFGELKGLTREKAKKSGLEYLKKVDLLDKKNVEIKKLSSGQQQKIQLGITIINDPKVLILDEPTKGLDPVNRNLLLNILLDLNKKGSTIIFSTHQMEEVEKIANRLVMIDNGKRALYGEVNKVRESFGDDSIQVLFNGKFPKDNKLFTSEVKNNYAVINPKDGVRSEEVLKYLVDSKLNITKFEVSAPSLNEIFIKVIEQDEAKK